ncbi:MAG: glycosyl hydrolase family 18 protein [Clostridiaceae bacterium]
MQNHVVKAGDTLYNISRKYGLKENDLISSNMITNPNNLVVGQVIVIPIWGKYHFVEPGDTLYKIAELYDIPYEELIRINNIANPDNISVGYRIYIPSKRRKIIDVAAYVDPRITRERTASEVAKVSEDLTYINVFSYEVDSLGNLKPVKDNDIINASYKSRTLPLMVLTNIEDGNFSTEVATKIFNSESLQEKVLNQAIEIMDIKGYRGLDFDFEYLGKDNKEKYNEFLRKASSKLKPKGYYLSSALAPKISSTQIGTLYEGHDYKTQGEIVDFIFFMTYEWGWSGGPPRAVSPIDKVKDVLDYAVSEVPRNKIMMGIPLYGYDWTLPYVKGGKFAKAISMQKAIDIARKYGAEIKYDGKSQAPYYNYYDELGKKHEVWFEDGRSIQAKFDLVKSLNIRGVFYWVIGKDFPQNWLLIEDNFIVRKLI